MSSASFGRARAQVRARSGAQKFCLSLLVINAGIALGCLSTGYPALGSALAVLGIVSLAPFLIWMQTTRLPR